MIYSREELLKAYFKAEEAKQWENDLLKPLKDDYIAFSDALQQAFEIQIEPKGYMLEYLPDKEKYLNILFINQQESYRQLSSGNITEAGDLTNTLKELGVQGEVILDRWAESEKLAHQLLEVRLEIMVMLADMMWPSPKESVTSEDLLAVGFDDSKRPSPLDYF